jgi:phosphoribosyl 1,2-cyclic phosphodiesterase
MELKILSSSSLGNCYIMEGEREALVIEAGVSLDLVKRAVDFKISKIKGCIVSHRHQDHSRYISRFLQSSIPVYVNSSNAMTFKDWRKPIAYVENKSFHIGEFKIKAFPLKHDVPCSGFLVSHPECGVFCFVTDTQSVPYHFPGLNHLLLEINYSDEILDDNILNDRIPAVVRNRVQNAHMSLDTAKFFLYSQDLSAVQDIILIHLSAGNSNAVQFQREIQENTGKKVIIADKDMTISFNKNPF